MKSKDLKDKRPRTPSGQPLTPKVEDIRNFLQAKAQQQLTPKALCENISSLKTTNMKGNDQQQSQQSDEQLAPVKEGVGEKDEDQTPSVAHEETKHDKRSTLLAEETDASILSMMKQMQKEVNDEEGNR